MGIAHCSSFLFFTLLYCTFLYSYSTLLFTSDFESHVLSVTHRIASQWEQEERQSEREREHIITEQDTAASHYNDLVRNMVRRLHVTSEDYPRTIIQTDSFKHYHIERISFPCHTLCASLEFYRCICNRI
jgi:hypothetical protein